jgi:murein DD-endopeptidase MepM/ murein hydrolase activator NlpD
MRRGVWLLVLGGLLAALGAASAYAAGTTTTESTTTTSTTTTGTTTTSTTATTTGATTTAPAPPTYSRLVGALLPTGCVGAGAAAIAEPGRRVLVLGTPAADRGPSVYPTNSPILKFLSSTASGSTCGNARVTLESLSLFGGVITAKSVTGTHGRGSLSGFEIYGSPVRLEPGHGVSIGGWGEVTLEKTVGRLTAPLVVQLLRKHRSLPAGTTIAFAFGASAQPVAGSKGGSRSSGATPHTGTNPARQGSGPAKPKHPRHRAKVAQPLTATPGLGYKPSHYVFPVDGGASYGDTYGAGRNDIYDGWHHGDDLFAPLGTPVVAVAKGTLSLVGWNTLGGWRLWLTDKKGNSFYYAHLAGYARSILTHRHVEAGQVLGFLGRTGDAFTTPPHLHFEIHPHQPAFVNLGYDGAVDPTRYLHVWKVEHVPANEIPQPARLKAPVGTPRQEAAVVWHQLLVARHLTTPATSASSSSSTSPAKLPFPHPPSFLASGATPLAIAHVLPTAAYVPASQESDLPVLVGAPVGGIVLLAAGALAFVFRRRRKTASEAPVALDPSS